MKKKILVVLSILLGIAIVSFSTYRITMDHISVSISEDTAQLTVYGQTDDYDYNIINMNPTQNNNAIQH